MKLAIPRDLRMHPLVRHALDIHRKDRRCTHSAPFVARRMGLRGRYAEAFIAGCTIAEAESLDALVVTLAMVRRARQ